MFSITAEGLPEAKVLLETIEKLGTIIKGIELNARDRAEGNSDKNNAEIADFLAESGRDFFSPDGEMIKAIEKAGLEALENQLQKIPVKSKGGIHLTLDSKKAAQAAAAKAFRAAMKAALEIIVDRIESQSTAGGGRPAMLSEAYQVEKEFQHGFVIPIGVATGQLLDNLNPTGNRNIKLRK